MPFFFTFVCMVALDVPGMAVYTHPFSPGSDFLVITQEPEQKLSSRPHRSTSTENMKAVWSSRRYNGPEVPSTSPNSHPHPYILVFHNLNCHLQPVQPMAREQRRTGGSKAGMHSPVPRRPIEIDGCFPSSILPVRSKSPLLMMVTCSCPR